MLRALVALSVLLVGSGCLFLETRENFSGDLKVAWTLGGTTDCAQVGVDEVVVTITRVEGSGNNVGPTGLPCADGQVSVEDLREGEYRLTLQGVRKLSEDEAVVLFEDDENFVILGGGTTDLGTLDLRRVVNTPGELRVDWTFQQVDADPTPACDVAGVDNVRIIMVDDAGQTVFDDVTDCLNGPTGIADIAPGNYLVTLEGMGTYNDLDVTYYRASNVAVTIQSDTITDLGVVQLNVLTDNFGDLDVNWTLEGRTCQTAGVTRVTVRIYRLGRTSPEDSFEADCVDGHALRTTFLPGDWRTVVEAVGNEGGTTVNWSGQLEHNVAPGQVSVYTVTMRPI
ncbi:MAG: hypothetical protein AB2A00_13750 [Myxococcota bacterium]